MPLQPSTKYGWLVHDSVLIGNYSRRSDPEQQALDELPLICRQVFVHNRIEGCTHAEISTACFEY